MDKKNEDIQIESSEEKAEYFEEIKASVEDKSYFKDALDWYFFRYVTPICDRTLLIFGAIIAAVVLFFLFQLIQGTFPLVERPPVFVAADDPSISFPNIVSLKPKKGTESYDQEIKTVDEAVAKYMLSLYVKERESYDFSKAEAEEVNRKFNYIKTLSSADEYRNFQLIMSPDNPDSPIKNFGYPITKNITVESVRFHRKEAHDFKEKMMKFILVEVPSEVEVRFSSVIKTRLDSGIKEEKQRYLAKIKFRFDGVKKDEKTIKFTVSSYKLYNIR
jgi:type IV secretory pathway component VirB8